MDSLLADLKYSVRTLLKSPGYTALSVLALTLGIGLTTTMFSIVYGALYRGLPFAEPERILHLERNNLAQDIQSMGVPVHDYVDWRSQQSAFEDIAAFYQGTVNISGAEGRAERFDGGFMTANAFDVLGVRPMLGRSFREGEDRPQAPMVVLLGHTVWRDRYQGDPNAVGRTIRANGETAEIIGVMPEGFRFPMNEDLWVPMRQDPLALPRGEGTQLEVFGRLKHGVSTDQAAAEYATIARRLAQEYPETNDGVGVVLQPYTEEFIGQEPIALLWTMLAAVFLVLLIACANVANLLLARATVRSKEVAVRTALGASRFRVVRQFLSETLVLSVIGGALGVGLAWVGVRMFNNAIVSTQPPFWIDIKIDAVAIAFVLALALTATVLSGILPALRASGANVHEILKDESRGTSSLRLGKLTKGLVVMEIALSCGLLVGAGLMIKSVVQLRTIDLGFATDDVFTARLGLFPATYPDTVSRLQFFDELRGRLGTLPGVRGAALTTNLPGLGTGRWSFAIEGTPYATDQDYPRARVAVITPGFFETFGVAVGEGRDFGAQDIRGSLPVTIVNASFARKFFPNESPIGRRIRQGRADSRLPWLTIVGIAPDMHMYGLGNDERDQEGFYLPLGQADAQFISIAVRGPRDPMALAPIVRDGVFAMDNDLPLYWVRTLSQGIAESTWFYRVFGTLFMIFGFTALFLGGVGLYGVMAFSVSRRTQEVGVRMALGAQTGDVLRLVLRQGLFQLGVGLFLGLALAAGLSHLLRIILFQVEPRDPVIFATIALVLFAIGMLASYFPARRATRVDPVAALRYE